MKPPNPLPRGKEHTYQLETVANRGSHAIIWRAIRSDGVPVAIKTRDRESGFPVKWLEQEGDLLHHLTGLAVPGIIPLLEILEWDGEPALVFPWRPLTLAGLEKAPWSRLRPLLASVAASLRHLHQLGWIHGDVTPGNILLDPSGQNPCLTDFGLARRLDAGDNASRPVINATPGFGNTNNPTPGPHTDWHSLGVCAWLLSIGEMPPAKAPVSQLAHLARERGLAENLAWDLAWWVVKGSSPRRLVGWLQEKKGRLIPGRYRTLLQTGHWLLPILIVLAILVLFSAWLFWPIP